MTKIWRILVINPGSTSTKLAVFENRNEVLDYTIRHENNELIQFQTIPEQEQFRFKAIEETLVKNGLSFNDIDAIAARGGLIKPIESGTYEINDAMVKDLTTSFAALHASSLAGLIGFQLKQHFHIPAYVVDPVVVDEYSDVARLTGIPTQERISVFHALNHKAIAKECALSLEKRYEDCNFIIAHMGGGITVAAHQRGHAIDVNNGVEGEGSFSPERCGSIPVSKIVEMCFSGEYQAQDIKDLCTKTGGLIAHLGTNDLRVCEAMIAENNAYAKLVYEAMAYQIAKDIGAMSTVLSGEIDAIILTGGLAYSKNFTSLIEQRVKFLAPIKLYPGEFEMKALAYGVLEVLNNQTNAKNYQ